MAPLFRDLSGFGFSIERLMRKAFPNPATTARHPCWVIVEIPHRKTRPSTMLHQQGRLLLLLFLGGECKIPSLRTEEAIMVNDDVVPSA